jgi:hypothetical protein
LGRAVRGDAHGELVHGGGEGDLFVEDGVGGVGSAAATGLFQLKADEVTIL